MLAARKLLRRAGRDESGTFLIEGLRAVGDALQSGAEVIEVFVVPDLAADPVVEAARGKGRVTPVTQNVIQALSDTATPQGLVAVVRSPEVSLGAIPEDTDLALVLAEVRDPGNAGTLVRSAVAAGAGAVIFGAGSVDPWSPKTVRASAGTILRIPVIRAQLGQTVDALRARGLAVVGSAASGAVPTDSVDLTRPVAVVVGNEAWGMSDGVAALLDEVVTIPMPGPVESLNAGIAGSILMFEAVRQRRQVSSARA